MMATAPKWIFSLSSTVCLSSAASPELGCCKKSFQKYSPTMPAASVGLEIGEGTSWSDNYGHHSLQYHCCSIDPKQITVSLPKKYSSKQKKYHWVISNVITHFLRVPGQYNPHMGAIPAWVRWIKVKPSIFQLNWLRSRLDLGKSSQYIRFLSTNNLWGPCLFREKNHFQCRLKQRNLLQLPQV